MLICKERYYQLSILVKSSSYFESISHSLINISMTLSQLFNLESLHSKHRKRLKAIFSHWYLCKYLNIMSRIWNTTQYRHIKYKSKQKRVSATLHERRAWTQVNTWIMWVCLNSCLRSVSIHVQHVRCIDNGENKSRVPKK